MNKTEANLEKLNRSGFLYEPEEDVLMFRISKEKIDSAEKQGNIIIHFSKENKPVLFEIFNAIEFLKQASNQLPRSIRQKVLA